MSKKNKKILVKAVILSALLLIIIGIPSSVKAEGGLVTITDGKIARSDDPADVATTLELMFLITILALAPSIIIMTTSFTRIIIVLSFIRRALATQELPPNQILIGISLILTFMIMTPTLTQIKDKALIPYMNYEITQSEAISISTDAIRNFMLPQTRTKDLKLFLNLTGKIKSMPKKVTPKDIPTHILIPSFIISELRRAFIMGFAIFLPFVIIDLVVASVLISMGMLVLPPILISLPFKILLFVLVDGWHLIVGSIVKSFYVNM